ncbi:YciI family protein [Spirosoma gilvum]
MKEYVFLVQFGLQQTLTPEQQKQNSADWGKLIQHWTEQGVFVGSSLINQPGVVISGPERTVSQGYLPNADFRVVSAIRVMAADLNEAVEMAKSCPILAYQGKIEVREVQARPVLA